MEFVGNQINIKTVLLTGAIAFLIGRINLFGGTFPAATALITVMIAVSTIYIYLIPVLAVAMLSCSGQGVDFYGDLMAVLFCGVFFLFFHRQRFTINQRSAVAAAAVVLFHCVYYGAGHMLYLLSVQTMIKEVVAVILYIRVFNTIAKLLFIGKDTAPVSREKAGFALMVLVVSILGAPGTELMVFPLQLFAILTVQYCLGIQSALAMTAVAAVFCQCRNEGDPQIYLFVMIALIAGWFLASLIDGRYRKTVLAAVTFAVLASSAIGQIYGAAAALAVFIAIPPQLLTKLWCVVEERFAPQAETEIDLRLAAAKRDLLKKKQTFSSLAKLYGEGIESRQILSYQFTGMVRTVDQILQILEGRGVRAERKENRRPDLSIGEASYAFEDVSGDSCLSFSFGENKQALMISDGMGKGSRAAAESKLVVTTIARLLEAGFDVDIAMKTVNGILTAANRSDMFATVDLAIIDKENGRAQIFKMGAASTFVKHDGKVAILKRPALPAGIASGMNLEYIDVRLRRGDILVMVSDGITDCDRADPDCVWLRERLLSMGSRDPETVAELIVNKAAEKYGIRERDDLTVMVAAI